MENLFVNVKWNVDKIFEEFVEELICFFELSLLSYLLMIMMEIL